MCFYNTTQAASYTGAYTHAASTVCAQTVSKPPIKTQFQLYTQRAPRLPRHPACTHLSSWPFYHTQSHHPSPLTEAIPILSSHRDTHHPLAFHMLSFLPECEAPRAGTHQVCYSVPRSRDNSLIHELSVTQ